MPMYEPPVEGESREERNARWRSNAMTVAFLAALVIAALTVGCILWVTFMVAPDVASWSRP